LARFVDAPIDEVVQRAQRDELRSFFVRSDGGGRPKPTRPAAVSVAQARSLIMRKRYPDCDRPLSVAEARARTRAQMNDAFARMRVWDARARLRAKQPKPPSPAVARVRLLAKKHPELDREAR
jgi:hypothetical protein